METICASGIRVSELKYTTRIYLATTGEEHMRQLERLGLVT